MAGKDDSKVEDVERVVNFGKVFDHPRRVALLMEYEQRGACSATMLARDGFLELGQGDIDYHQKRLLEIGAVEHHDSRPRQGGK